MGSGHLCCRLLSPVKCSRPLLKIFSSKSASAAMSTTDEPEPIITSQPPEKRHRGKRPLSVSPTKRQEQLSNLPGGCCIRCEQELDAESKVIQCDLCGSSIHSQYDEVSENLNAVLGNLNNFVYYCDANNCKKKMAACLWLAFSVIMFCRFQRPFLTIGDTNAVLQDLDSSICEFSLVSSLYDCFKSPHVVLFNWNRRPFYLNLLLSLCGDIHLNPGPDQFLCGKYGCAVLDQDKALCCDSCDRWVHISCENSVSEDMYDYWVANPSKDSWFCSVCSSNVSCSLTTPTILSSGGNIRSLICWCLNARSVVNKRFDLFAKLSSLYPAIVMITETYLDDTINDSEIFPSNYTVY